MNRNIKAGIDRCGWVRFLSFVFIIFCLFYGGLYAQRITVNGTKFMVGGNELFINGVNTPWDNWNDFGGQYDPDFWDLEFQRIRQHGGNASRIWITCNGDVGINISQDGNVSGATEAHWEDLDHLFELALKHRVYIMATLISFDHTKNTYIKYQSWRNMLGSDAMVATYIDNYVIPFIDRYKDNPYLWCVDACNEIEWMHENPENGQIAWERLQYFVARVAAAVHDNSPVLVTLGSAAVKWNSDCSGCEGNFWSDENLQSQISSPAAFLDFYSPHYYGWVVRWYGNFALDKTPDSYGLVDRPVMIGENPATGVFKQNTSGVDELEVPMDEAYVNTYNNGWRGLMVWTSNGVDQYGSLEDCGQGLFNFFREYPDLVNPSITGMEIEDNETPISLYPNPTSGIIYLDFSNPNEYHIGLYDLNGNKMTEKKITGFRHQTLDIQSFSRGIYLLNLSSGDDFRIIKIIKN